MDESDKNVTGTSVTVVNENANQTKKRADPAKSKAGGSGPLPDTKATKNKGKAVKSRAPRETASQLICSDILFLEAVIQHLRDCDVQSDYLNNVVSKLRSLVRQKLRSLNSTGTGKCLEDSVDLLKDRVRVLQRTVMERYWDQYQSLREKMPPTDNHGHRRTSRYDDASYSPDDFRPRRDSLDPPDAGDDLSSTIDRLDRFISQKYREDVREVRKHSMPRLHRRQSVNNGGAEQTLAEKILRSRKSNRNEYNSPRSVSETRQIASPVSVYSRVSAGSSKVNGYVEASNRSPPDGGSYHEEILDLVSTFNGRGSAMMDKRPLEKKKTMESGKSYLQGQSVQSKISSHARRGSDDSVYSRDTYRMEDRGSGFPQLDQPHPHRDSEPHLGRPVRDNVHKSKPVATKSVGTQSVGPKPVGTKSFGTKSLTSKPLGSKTIRTTARVLPDKKKRKGRSSSPRTDRTSWMRTVNYEQAPRGVCACGRHKEDEKSPRTRTNEPAHRESRPQPNGSHKLLEVNSGDIPRPRVYGRAARQEHDHRALRERDAEMEMEEFKQRFDNRALAKGSRRQPSPHNGEKIFDYNIRKDYGNSSVYDDDYIRQYRSLQL